MTEILRPGLVSSNSFFFLPQSKLCVSLCIFLRISVCKKITDFCVIDVGLTEGHFVHYSQQVKWLHNFWAAEMLLWSFDDKIEIENKKESLSSKQHSSSFSINRSSGSWIFLHWRKRNPRRKKGLLLPRKRCEVTAGQNSQYQ